MARILGLILLSMAAFSGAAAQAEVAIHYRLTPIVDGDRLTTVAVDMVFPGDADGVTVIELPDRWAGTERLYERLSNITVEGGTLLPGADPAHRIVTHARRAALHLRYTLAPSGADPGPGYEKAHPLVRPGYFYIHGEGAMAVPEGRGENTADLAWGPSPDGWTLASDLDGATSLSAGDVTRGIFTGGTDWRMLTADAGGRQLRLAIRGDWTFSDEHLRDDLARIIAAENAYLSADAIPYFVSLIPETGAETGALSSGGTGRTHGFALAATQNIDLNDFLRTIAHEYGHRWFGGEFGPVAEDDAIEYWFTEGFGDFLAGHSLVAANVWDPTDYATMLNRTLLRHASSPARNLSNNELARRFWDGPEPMQAPYDRGHLFALGLDGTEGALRTPLVRMATQPDSFDPATTQSRRFLEAFAVEPALLAAMLNGEDIALPVDLFAACGRIAWAEQPVYAPGYTAESDDDGLYFADMVRDSPAWRAGLRPGMRYLRRVSFAHGDATVPIVMRVGDGDGERTISWLPEGDRQVRFQKLVLDEGADENRRCLERLGG